MQPQPIGLFEKLRHIHWPLVAMLVVLGAVGYAILYSAAGGAHEPWAWRHGLRFGVGLVVMLGVALIDVKLIYRFAYHAFALALCMLLVVEFMGEINKGAQRWIDLGVVQLQPSEIMKVCLIVALARFFHDARPEDIRRPLYILPALLFILLPAGLVLLQPDLGTATTLAAAGAAMLFLAGVPVWQFAAIGVVAAAALPILWAQLHDYQRQRVLTFLNPDNDPLGSGYHIIQSKIALGSGGLWGKGYLEGSQAQLNFLPEKQTDFAFTMLGEEVGFIGCLVVLAVFLILLATTMLIALRSANHFGRLYAMGMSVTLTLYASINVAMVTGLAPVVGIPLPLISYGGTAMLTVLFGFGLVLSVDLHRHSQIPRYPNEL
jgi:rod shape determining protein RodA